VPCPVGCGYRYDPGMPARVGFWSYVHDDDGAEGGRILQLAKDLREQYALISGESIDIFVDRDDLKWGDDWREQIDSSLASILFFIAVITPRYFSSAQCRRELHEFARGAERLGIRELILPLVYVDVSALHEESPVDEAIALVKTYQWQDWRDLRFEDVTSGAYRRAVAGLAQKLIDANQRILAEEPPAPEGPTDTEGPEGPSGPKGPEGPEGPETPGPDETPGTLDVLARGEEALPNITETLTAISSEIETVGSLAQQAAEDMGRSDQQGFAGRLAVSRKLAQDLSAPAERVLELANSYTTSLYEADTATRMIIAQAPAEIRDNPADVPGWEELSTSIIELANITSGAMASTQGLVDSMAQLESISRDLRPPIQKLRRGLTILTEGSSVISEWKRLVDEANASLA
jgi:TIR domain